MKHWKLIITLALVMGSAVSIGVYTFKHHSTAKVEKMGGDKTASVNPADVGELTEAQKKEAADKAGTASSTSVTGQAGVSGGVAGTTGAGAVNGAAPGSVAGAPVATAEKPAEKPKPESNCFVYEYQHKAEAKHKDIEDFMDFTNAFAITHKNFNAKTVCVKVNQQPVAYKIQTTKGQAEIILGAVVGPESVIKVSYCTGDAGCKENCALPQKRFMDDLVSDASEDEFGDSWDSNSPKTADQKKKLHENVKAFRSVASENDSLTKQSVMRDWATLNHQESVCKLK